MVEKLSINPVIEEEIKKAMSRLTDARRNNNYELFNRAVSDTFQTLSDQGISIEYADLYDLMRSRFDSDEEFTSVPESPASKDTEKAFTIIGLRVQNVNLFAAQHGLTPRQMTYEEKRKLRGNDGPYFSLPADKSLYASFNTGNNYFVELTSYEHVKQVFLGYQSKGTIFDLQLWEGSVPELSNQATQSEKTVIAI